MSTKLAESARDAFSFERDLARALRGDIPVAAFVQRLAHERGVSYMRDEIDDFAEAVSRLSDAEVDLDEIQWLLMALDREAIVTSQQAILLHAIYLRQRAK